VANEEYDNPIWRNQEIWNAQANLGEKGSDWVSNFVASAIAGTGALVGIPKPPQVEAWEAGHPIGGLAASLVGPFGYYGMGAKIGRNIMSGTKLMRQIDNLAEGRKYQHE
jgi:hypothetical protein